MRNKIGITLLIIGGILMIVSSTIGSIGVYEFLRDYVLGLNITEWIKNVVSVFVEILRWIANTGGIAVIVGAALIGFKQHRFGKWLISIGLAFGTLALIIWLISTIVDLTGFITDPQILGYLDRIASLVEVHTVFQISGVIVAIVGRNFVKKPKKVKEEEVEEVETPEEKEKIESTPPAPFQNIYCPNCGSSLPFNSQFCTECGSSLDKE